MENSYQDKFTEYLRNVHNNMFTFEVTKCCGYSTFITVYKNQSLLDLYSNILHHFGNIQIKKLYFISPQGQQIDIPISNKTVSEFVQEHNTCNPIKLTPIYNLPLPVVYKLILDDTSNCSQEHCCTVHYMNR